MRGEDRDEQRIDWSGFMRRVGVLKQALPIPSPLPVGGPQAERGEFRRGLRSRRIQRWRADLARSTLEASPRDDPLLGGSMRRKHQLRVLLLGTAIASFQPCLASASDRTRHLTISAFGGYQTYDMPT